MKYLLVFLVVVYVSCVEFILKPYIKDDMKKCYSRYSRMYDYCSCQEKVMLDFSYYFPIYMASNEFGLKEIKRKLEKELTIEGKKCDALMPMEFKFLSEAEKFLNR